MAKRKTKIADLTPVTLWTPEERERMRREEAERAERLAASYPIQGDILATAQFACMAYARQTYTETMGVYGDHARALATASRYLDAANTMRAAIGAPPFDLVETLRDVWQGPPLQ